MQATDERRFDMLLEAVYAFYGKDLSEFTVSVWWNAMRPFDLHAVKDAFGRHAANPDTGRFLPFPADILALLGGGRSIDVAQAAWSKVNHALRSVGPYQSVAFDDALIHRVLQDMGGWIALGYKSEHEWPFVAREFCERLRGYILRGERPDYPAVLAGLAQTDNESHGHAHTDSVVLIGDPSRARQVMERGAAQPLIAITLK